MACHDLNLDAPLAVTATASAASACSPSPTVVLTSSASVLFLMMDVLFELPTAAVPAPWPAAAADLIVDSLAAPSSRLSICRRAESLILARVSFRIVLTVTARLPRQSLRRRHCPIERNIRLVQSGNANLLDPS